MKSRKTFLTISEILQRLSNRTKHASEKCNECVGNYCPALRIPVGSNPLASNTWTSRIWELTSQPGSDSQARELRDLSTQHRLREADGGWEGPQEEREQRAGRRKPWNNPKSPSQRPAATDRALEQSPGWKQLVDMSRQSIHGVQRLPQLSHGALTIYWGWVTDKHLSPAPHSPYVKKELWLMKTWLFMSYVFVLGFVGFFFLIHAI